MMNLSKILSLPDEFEIPEAARPEFERNIEECQGKIKYILDHYVFSGPRKIPKFCHPAAYYRSAVIRLMTFKIVLGQKKVSRLEVVGALIGQEFDVDADELREAFEEVYQIVLKYR